MGRDHDAIALDYDGTLTDTDRPGGAVLAAIGAVRRSGRAVVLVTGRVLSDLRAVFPEVDGHVDAIVAENGAVLADGDGDRDLVPPVDRRLARALARRGVPVHRGRVLLACAARYDHVVAEEVARLGLDCEVVRNRAALMVLPGGVTKGTGLVEALATLGVAPQRTVGIGDAENDVHLLGACGLGVAVGNAVDALRAHADVVLPAPDGAGVAAFLADLLATGDPARDP